jgi:hypothetical protein
MTSFDDPSLFGFECDSNFDFIMIDLDSYNVPLLMLLTEEE